MTPARAKKKFARESTERSHDYCMKFSAEYSVQTEKFQMREQLARRMFAASLDKIQTRRKMGRCI
jgi:hypothetical protein